MTNTRTSRNLTRGIFLGAALTLAAPAPVTAFLGFSTGAGAPPLAIDQTLPGPVAGEALVRFKPGVDRREARAALPGPRVSLAREFPLLSASRGREYGLVRSSSVGTAELLALLKADPRVDAVMPNFVGRIAAVPSDPLFGELWGLHNTAQEVLGVAGTPDADIDAPEAWDEGAPAPGAVVAVIDTGVDYTHEDLAAAAWANPGEVPGNGLDDDGNGWVDDMRGIDTHNRDADPMDDHGHGTHVTGTIAALPDNGVGIAGVAPGARFIAVKTFDEDGRGTVADVIAAIEYVTDLKVSRSVDVAAINASFGFYSNQTWLEVSLEDGDILSDAIAAASDAGIMFIAAAGNYGVNNDESRPAHIIYPASYNLPNVIAVGASDANDERAPFSNWGPKTVDLFAPGVSTLSTIPGGGYDPGMTGTDLFLDRLEGGGADWSHRGLGDTWELSDVESRGPGHGFTAVVPPEGPASGAVLELERDVDLSRAGGGTVELAFWAAASLSGADGLPSSLKVQISPNGGTSWWLTPGTITGSFDWRLFRYTLPLSQLSSRVRVRFVLEGHPDGAGLQRLTLDDIGIGMAPSAAYGWASGTSMAAPHVTGAVALMAARYPREGIAARRNRLLTGVDAAASFADRVVTGARLNLAKAAGSDVPPLIAALDPPGGALPGGRVRVTGVNFGPDPGRVLLEATPRSDYRADRFCFRILKTSDLDDIAHDGVHVDDVRLGTASTVFFEDDMESGDGKWLGVGRPPHGATWEISDEQVHGGSRAWSDSTEATFGGWGQYPSGQFTYLRNLAPVDLTGTAGERVTLGFWAMVTTFAQDPVTVWFSRDGGESWAQVAELPNSEGWVHHEFEVAGATPAVEATVLSWSDTDATIEVPGGALHHLRVLTAAGTPSSNHAPLTAWASRTPVGWPTDTGSPLVALGGKLYLLGMTDTHDGIHEISVAVYEPATDAWTEKPEWRLAGRRFGQAAAALGGKIYLVGGGPYDETTRVDIFDPARGSWTRGAALPGGLSYLAAVRLGDALYVAGGATQAIGATRAVYRIVPGSSAWTRVADMRLRRAGHAAVAARGKIYVFGGHDLLGQPLAAAEVYDPAIDEWAELPDLPDGARDFAGAATDGRFIYVTAGSAPSSTRSSDATFVYDAVAESWTVAGGTSYDLGTPRLAPGMAFVPGDGIYVTGGNRYGPGLLERLDAQRGYDGLDVIWPDGGERLGSGAAVTFTWGAPPSAHHFTVAFGAGGSWITVAEGLTATAVRWRLPVLDANQPDCRVRVTAYDEGGGEIAVAESAAAFRVDVVQLLWPRPGSSLFAGSTYTIRWRTWATRQPVARVVVEYNTEWGPWRRAGFVDGNPGRIRWRVPSIEPSSLADSFLRVTLRDARGRSLGAAGNEYPFFIRGSVFSSLPAK